MQQPESALQFRLLLLRNHDRRPLHHTVNWLVIRFRRLIRPPLLALVRVLPSPERCGCAARKEWLIRYIESI